MMTEKKAMELVIHLGQLTTEYCSLERDKEAYYISHIKDMSRTTIVTLYLKQAYIDSVIKKIIITVDRLNRAEVDFDNECATLVYNYYAPSLRRGLSDLL